MMEIILLPSVLFFCMVLCFLVIGFSSYYLYINIVLINKVI